MLSPHQSSDDGRGLVVFLPGLWLHSSSWRPWVELFHGSGYDCVVVSWPGEGVTAADSRARRTPPVGGLGPITDRVEAVIAALPKRPIIIGHGIGGLIAHTVLGRDAASAAIAVSPVVPSLTAFVGLLRTWPCPRPWQCHRWAAMPDRVLFCRRYANTVAPGEAAALYERYVIPTSGRPLIDAAAMRWHRRSPRAWAAAGCGRGPLLLISGGRDLMTPERTVGAFERRNRRQLPGAVSDHQVFPDRGHSITIDMGWRDVAYFCLDWLTSHDL